MVQQLSLLVVSQVVPAGAGQADGQTQDMPGLAYVVAALFLESDDPNQNKKIQFENNFQIPEDEFPAEKEKILLLAYSRFLLPNTPSFTNLVLYCQGWLQLCRPATLSQQHSILLL